MVRERHGDDGVGGMAGAEDVVDAAKPMLAVEGFHAWSRDLVALDGRDVVDEEIAAALPHHVDIEDGGGHVFADHAAAAGMIVRRDARKAVHAVVQDADHDRPRPSAGARRGDEGERPDVAAECRDHGVVDGLAPVRAMSVVGLGRVGWRLALPPLIELGGACRAPLRIKRPVDGLRIDRPPFGTRLLEVLLAQPRLLRHLGAFAIDLRLGQPPVGFERVPIAPQVDGPAPGGGALEHRGHRAVGVLMRTADDRLSLPARPVHRLTVRGIEHRQQHLIGFVDPEALRVRPAHGGLGGRPRP